MVNENEHVLNVRDLQYVHMVPEKVYVYNVKVHPFVSMIKLKMIVLFVHQIMVVNIVIVYLLNTPVGNPIVSVVTVF
jgi:hypothetical protein